MRYILGVLITSCILTATCNAQSPSSLFGQKDYNQKAYDALLTNYFGSSIYGGAALVAKEGEIIYEKAMGMANLEDDIKLTTNHKFRIASNTKQFTACAILKLQEEGKLHTSDNMLKYIPDYPTHGHTITIEQLLTHTSGIRDFSSSEGFSEIENNEYSKEEFINYFKNLPIVGIPGEQYHYSNSAYFLLGYIIEKVSGKSYGEYLENSFFQPLGMANTFFDFPTKTVQDRALGYAQLSADEFTTCKEINMSIPFAAGGLVSTVHDMCLWYQALKNGKVVNKENLKKAHSPYQLNNDSYTRYGYGWDIGTLAGSQIIAHGGAISGYYSTLVYLPNENILAVVLTNCNWMDATFFDLATRMASVALDKIYYKNTPLSNLVLEAYEGIYKTESKSKTIITLEGNKAFMTIDGTPKRELHYIGEDTFYSEINYTTVEFLRDNEGSIKSLITTRAVSTNYIKIDQ